jgi:hypothetical protein
MNLPKFKNGMNFSRTPFLFLSTIPLGRIPESYPTIDYSRLENQDLFRSKTSSKIPRTFS